MPNRKKYIITSITLGAIAAASAALIGVTNLLTAQNIKKNEKNKINAGIASIFGKNSSIIDEKDIKEYQYTNHSYVVKTESSESDLALRTTGSNLYGKISMLVGLKDQGESGYVFVGIYLITNEQTYAATLEDNYIDPLNKGDRSLEDVSCGATYGAKLIRDMVNEAIEVANK